MNYLNKEINVNKKKRRIIVIMRHGERSDLAGIEIKLNISDPELTDIGKNQAYEAGVRLKEILEEYFIEENSELKNKKIAIISSPFSRTLETAKYAKNGMGLNLPIFIENGIAEFISKGWFKNSPKEFLCYFRLLNPIFELKENIEIKQPEYFINEFMNEILIYQPIGQLPDYPESTNSCITRFRSTLDLIVNFYSIKKDFDVLILVTHVFGLQSLCEKMEIPIDYFDIEYCSTFIFIYDEDTGKFFFDKNFYPILH